MTFIVRSVSNFFNQAFITEKKVHAVQIFQQPTMIPTEWKWVLDQSVANTVTLRAKETIFDDTIFTVDTPSDMLCNWIHLSINNTSCTEPNATFIRVICLLSRCIENSSKFIDQGLVLTLSNIVSLLGLSMYFDCIWVEDSPHQYYHWTRIMRCSQERMLKLEERFIKMLRYRLHVSDSDIQSVTQRLNDTYKSHLLVGRQPISNNRTKEVAYTHMDFQEWFAENGDEEDMLCTEMFVN